VIVTPTSVAEKFVGPVPSSGMTTAPELRNPLTVSTGAAQPFGVLPPEAWMQVQSDFSPHNSSVLPFSILEILLKHNNNTLSSSFADTKVINLLACLNSLE
jgi:hypothetical protein